MANGREFDVLLEAAFGYACSLTHSDDRAWDLLQDACVALVASDGPWHRGYLFTTIRNRFIDEYRRNMKLKFEPLSDDERAMSAVRTLRAEDVIDYVAAKETVEQALSNLRPEEREVLYLSAVEEYTVTEIAELIDKPRGTVLSLLHRAKARVRRRAALTSDRAPLSGRQVVL
ncbi:MAG: RNA polymerase sigma factor [Phycisphaerales bacterium]|nr:RNA polymerase sigma factor [Phycisphaerales bacterium]